MAKNTSIGRDEMPNVREPAAESARSISGHGADRREKSSPDGWFGNHIRFVDMPRPVVRTTA